MVKIKRIKIRHVWNKIEEKIPDLFQRINDNIMQKAPTVILIDGKTQTGKSTLARYICSRYDPNYTTIFTVEDFLKYLNFLYSKLENIDGELMLPKQYCYKWILFDEVELETPSQKFYADKNIVLQSIIAGFGFLKQNMIMTLPDLRGISELLYINITMRISVKRFLNYNKEIVRTAFIKIPLYNDNKRKYWWINVQASKIQPIETDKVYNTNKTKNFFETQLPKWTTQLKINSSDDDYKPKGLPINI